MMVQDIHGMSTDFLVRLLCETPPWAISSDCAEVERIRDAAAKELQVREQR